jgi:hypothetical protein
MTGARLHFGKRGTFVSLDVRAQARPRYSSRHGLEIVFEGVGICEQRRGLKVVDVHRVQREESGKKLKGQAPL